jgi:hypothetical protein
MLTDRFGIQWRQLTVPVDGFTCVSVNCVHEVIPNRRPNATAFSEGIMRISVRLRKLERSFPLQRSQVITEIFDALLHNSFVLLVEVSEDGAPCRQIR